MADDAHLVLSVLDLILPHLPDSWYVCKVCDIAVCLQCVSQCETSTHGTQHFLHVAVTQLGLGAWTRPQQLHGAGDQSDLTCTEHSLIHLQHTPFAKSLSCYVDLWNIYLIQHLHTIQEPIR